MNDRDRALNAADQDLHISRVTHLGGAILPRVWPRQTIRRDDSGVGARGGVRSSWCWTTFSLHHMARSIIGAARSTIPARLSRNSRRRLLASLLGCALRWTRTSPVSCCTDAGLSAARMSMRRRPAAGDMDAGWHGSLTLRWCKSRAGLRDERGRFVLTRILS